MSFENSKGKTYLNLPEQVAYVSNVLEGTKVKKITATNFNADNLSVNNTANIAGTLAVSGTADLGSNVEIDGNLTLNAPEDITFKEDNSTLKSKLEKAIYRHSIVFSASGQLDGAFDIYNYSSVEIKTYDELIEAMPKVLPCVGRYMSIGNASSGVFTKSLIIYLTINSQAEIVAYYLTFDDSDDSTTYNYRSILSFQFTMSDTVTQL